MGGNRGDIEEGATLGEKDDVVRLMTIHKSKGLEFPICLLVNCGQPFNKTRPGRIYSLIPSWALGLSLGAWIRLRVFMRRVKSIARAAIAGKLAEEARAEEARLMYVGMTRAVSRLIISGTITSKSAFMDGKYALSHANSFLDFYYARSAEAS